MGMLPQSPAWPIRPGAFPPGCSGPDRATPSRSPARSGPRAAVPSTIWDKPGPLTATDWERVRLHPYHSERILARSPALAPIGRVASMHHERQDGSATTDRPPGARFRSRRGCSPPPTHSIPRSSCGSHRPALAMEQAAAVLQEDGSAGRLDSDAVAGVLAPRPGTSDRRTWPGGLGPGRWKFCACSPRVACAPRLPAVSSSRPRLRTTTYSTSTPSSASPRGRRPFPTPWSTTSSRGPVRTLSRDPWTRRCGRDRRPHRARRLATTTNTSPGLQAW